jgi:multisubunit Na+/H+ antiporter MnhB subunit
MTDLKLAYTIETIDKSSAVNKQIAATIAAPGATAGRSVGILKKFAGGLDGIGVGIKGVIGQDGALGAIEKRFSAIAEAAKGFGGFAFKGVEKGGEALEKLTEKAEHSYGALAAAVGGGIEIGELIKDNDDFDRLRIKTGATREDIEGLRGDVLNSAQAWGVQTTEIRRGIDAMREGGSKIDEIRSDTDMLATSIQRLGGNGLELGDLFTTLRQFEDVKGPKDLLNYMSILNSQLEGVPGGIETFIAAARPLLSTYSNLGQRGPGAVRDVGALYGVISQSTANPRQARGETLNLINTLGGDAAPALAALGVNVFGSSKNWSTEDFHNHRMRPLSEVIPELLASYNRAPFSFDRVLGPDFRRDLKGPLSEIQATGKSASFQKLIGLEANPAEFLSQATEAGKEFSSSLNRVHAGILRIGDDVLSGPLSWLADRMSEYPTLTAAAAVGIGTVGIALATIGALAPGVRLVGGVLGAMGGISLSGIAVSLGAAAETIGGLVAFSPALSGLFGVIAEGFLAVGVAIAATPIGWIIAGIAAIAAGAYVIYRYWAPIKEFLAGLWDGFIERGKNVIDSIRSKLPEWLVGKSDPRGIADTGVKMQAGALAGQLAGRSLSANGPSPFPETRLGPAVPTVSEGPRLKGDGDKSEPLKANITLTFENAPPGLRVGKVSSNIGDLTIDLDAGYAMAGS